jgi:hypothetical protein
VFNICRKKKIVKFDGKPSQIIFFIERKKNSVFCEESFPLTKLKIPWSKRKRCMKNLPGWWPNKDKNSFFGKEIFVEAIF